jgi:hypothetical protein
VAGSYGFPTLSDVSGRIDDWLQARAGLDEADGARLARFCDLLIRALELASASGKDPDAIASDPGMVELISCA